MWQGWGLRVYLFHPCDHHIKALPGWSALLKPQESPQHLSGSHWQNLTHPSSCKVHELTGTPRDDLNSLSRPFPHIGIEKNNCKQGFSMALTGWLHASSNFIKPASQVDSTNTLLNFSELEVHFEYALV